MPRILCFLLLLMVLPAARAQVNNWDPTWYVTDSTLVFHDDLDYYLNGYTDDEIKQFLVDRYGDFVLYRPPMQQNTYLLWIAPLILLLIGAWILRASIGKRAEMLEASSSTDDGE